MAQYKLNISHNDPDEHINYNEAIEMLDNYKFHKVGQPIAVIYYDDNDKRQLMFAIGKMNYDDKIDGKNYGPEFYEIINDGTNYLGGNSHFMIIKNDHVYIRGIDSTGSTHDYKILNRECIIEQVEDTDIVTMGYLSEWGTFQNIE